MKMTSEKDQNFELNYVSKNILECIKFWNREGHKIYEQNKAGELGSKETQEQARKQTEDDFLLDCILCDAKTFCNSPDGQKLGTWLAGRTSSHVFIHFNDERIMLIRMDGPEHSRLRYDGEKDKFDEQTRDYLQRNNIPVTDELLAKFYQYIQLMDSPVDFHFAHAYEQISK